MTTILRPSQWAAALTLSAWLVVLLSAPAVLRVPVTLAFVLLAPGLGLVTLMELRKPLVEVMLAIGTSIALLILISFGMVKLGGWTATMGLYWLSVPALVGIVVESARRADEGR
jgi:uncharacterized membrane protein